jgi:hypothetical protein
VTRYERRFLTAALAAGTAIIALLATGGCAKITEPFNDARVAHKYGNPADVYSMPDGFNNFSEKCDAHGNRVFVIYHGDAAYGSVFAMKDPTCGKP